MKEDFILKNRGFFLVAFVVILAVTVFPLLTTGFATADDLLYYLGARRGLTIGDLERAARFSGRFYLYIAGPCYFLPYVFDNALVIKMFQYIPLALCSLLFAKIIMTLTRSKSMAWLFLLVFLFTMQISKHTSLFVAYPFYFTFSFLLLLASFLLLLKFYETGKRRALVCSVVLFAAGLLFYETYLLFLIFVMITIIARNSGEKSGFWKMMKKSAGEFLPYLFVGLVYLGIYFTYRAFHPSQYDGSNIAKSASVSSFLFVLWKLAYTSFPLTVYETSKAIFIDKSEVAGGYSPVLLRLFRGARVEWVVKGIFVAWCGFHLLVKLPRIRMRALYNYAGMALLLIFVPHIPLALSEKYTFYVEKSGMIGYVTTFFSFFGSVLLICLLLSYFINLLHFNKMVRNLASLVLVFLFFLCSLLTDYSNSCIARDIRSANLRFYAIDEFCKTDEFQSLPAGTVFYGRTLWDNPSSSAASITEQGFDWQDYFRIRTGKGMQVFRDNPPAPDSTGKTPGEINSLSLRQAEKSEDILLVMAGNVMPGAKGAEGKEVADRAFILYYSSYTCFTVTFHARKFNAPAQNVSLKINQITDEVPSDETVQITIYNTKKGNKSTSFTLEYPGIELNSIIISNLVNRGNKYFYL